jgi:hypothetical protein
MVGELSCPLHSIISGFQAKVKRISSNIQYFTVVFFNQLFINKRQKIFQRQDYRPISIMMIRILLSPI